METRNAGVPLVVGGKDLYSGKKVTGLSHEACLHRAFLLLLPFDISHQLNQELARTTRPKSSLVTAHEDKT